MTSSYQQQLDAKIERITVQFAEFAPPSLEVFQSPEKNFRMRAEFRIWHTEDDMFYAMFERDEDNQKKVIRIDDFPIADASINQLMPVLLAELKSNDLLSKRLFEVHFLATLKGEMLVSLIYRCPLDEQWQVLAKQLSEKHCDHKYNVSGTEITHQHHKAEHCDLCHFVFGNYISPKDFSYQLYSNIEEIPYFFTESEMFISFSGSLYSLRGPPVNS